MLNVDPGPAAAHSPLTPQGTGPAMRCDIQAARVPAIHPVGNIEVAVRCAVPLPTAHAKAIRPGGATGPSVPDANPAAISTGGRTALHDAAQSGDARLVAELLATSGPAPAMVPDMNGKTPLHYAAEAGRADVLEVFAADPRTLDHPDPSGRYAYHHAQDARGKAGADFDRLVRCATRILDRTIYTVGMTSWRQERGLAPWSDQEWDRIKAHAGPLSADVRAVAARLMLRLPAEFRADVDTVVACFHLAQAYETAGFRSSLQLRSLVMQARDGAMHCEEPIEARILRAFDFDLSFAHPRGPHAAS